MSLEKSRSSSSDDSASASDKRPASIYLDVGEEHVRFRKAWWQVWIPRERPPPPKLSLADAAVIPVASCSLFSMLTYSWVTPIMNLGYQRTLQASDLWKMDESRSSAVLSKNLDAAWDRRLLAAQDWNTRLEKGLIIPSTLQRMVWTLRSLASGTSYKQKISELERHWREVGGKRQASVAWALNDIIGRFFWSAGAFKVSGDTCQLMGPLVVKAIINFAKKRAAAKEAGEVPPSVGLGIAMAIALFVITIAASVSQHQFFWRSMVTGVLSRAALTSSIYKRGVKFTPKARTKISHADLLNHISTDVSRIDACAQWFHAAWTAPIQVIICLIILIAQLGPSALAGFALFLFVAPISERVMAHQTRVRRASMKFTDLRAKNTLEALSAMRIVKYFSYEAPFLKRIFDIRNSELLSTRTILNSQSANAAFAYTIPVLAATLAFVTYTQATAGFDVAVIFASLSLFNLLRQPMMFLPRALAAIADAQNAFPRLTKVFQAEVMTDDAFVVDPSQEWALKVDNATFTWEDVSSKEVENSMETLPASDDAPFQVQNISMRIPRGTVAAIVGRVGSGKSSLLQGLIGEMRKTSGSSSFGGFIAYCPQIAWIQCASLRDNITFGQPFDEDRYWKVVEAACLLQDLQLLPDGDLTEIGEKGINLSGGQKQRVNIARALYYNADIIILDDPLSAVDAHVGKALFHGPILNLRNQGKTVILVTHALYFLSHCDYIYTLHNGCITEQGTFPQLISKDGVFARLDKEFGGGAANPDILPDGEFHSHDNNEVDVIKHMSTEISQRAAGSGKLEGRLIVKERRTTGSVSLRVYGAYLTAGRGYITVPLIVLSILLMQSSQIVASYTLVWWQANTFNRPFSFYQILYAALGISQAIFTFILGMSTDTISCFVSRNLHHKAIHNIFHAPMSFFDTTPTGRILGIFGKDIDIIDNQLPISLRLLSLTLSNAFGAVVIITVLEHYFIIVAVAISLGYQYFAAFYRASAREVKRLDAMLRSILYAHLSESLTGLPTLRSYGEIARFVKDNEFYIDLENRALYLTVTNQRWLAIRLDFCGAIMVFFVALFAVIGVSGISAAQIGLVLTYTTTLTSLCGVLTRQTADVENYMNSVERVVHYSREDLVLQEAPYQIEDRRPSPHWPDRGAIVFQDVKMSYRPGLPNVLHGISLSINGGEKVGVVGRTGAGKSSLALTLLRIVEFTGSITVDGVDISKIGLQDLRTKMSIIPQDPIILSGTVRSTLDPFSMYDDAHLWDALRRSFLVDAPSTTSEESIDAEMGKRARITLDTIIEPEGANLSVGERSLLSLARALVKDTRVVILDEATASVDLETDAKIQYTIQTHFRDRTLLCIAHRLRTILSYDRILVLDAGLVAEFDTPSNLFRQGGIFRNLCDESNITIQDIEKSD